MSIHLFFLCTVIIKYKTYALQKLHSKLNYVAVSLYKPTVLIISKSQREKTNKKTTTFVHDISWRLFDLVKDVNMAANWISKLKVIAGLTVK